MTTDTTPDQATATPILNATAIGPVLPELPPVFVMEFKTPTMESRCFERDCRHPFALHYITFDNKGSGCAVRKEGPRGGDYGTCTCAGYVQMPEQPFRRDGVR